MYLVITGHTQQLENGSNFIETYSDIDKALARYHELRANPLVPFVYLIDGVVLLHRL